MSTLDWPLVSVTIGLVLLAAELALPTAGLLFVPAVALLALGLYQAFSDSTALGWRFLAAEAVLVPSTVAGSIFGLSRTLLHPRRAGLSPPGEVDYGVAHAGPGLDELVDRPGRALTPLRPSGKVDFGGRRLEAVAEAGLIEPGSAVRAVGVRSGRVVVRDASGDSAGPSGPTIG